MARVIDKGRAAITATLGSYLYDCPLDRIFFEALNISRDEVLDVLRQAYTSRLSYNAAVSRLLEEKLIPSSVLDAINAAVDGLPADTFVDRVAS